MKQKSTTGFKPRFKAGDKIVFTEGKPNEETTWVEILEFISRRRGRYIADHLYRARGYGPGFNYDGEGGKEYMLYAPVVDKNYRYMKVYDLL